MCLREGWVCTVQQPRNALQGFHRFFARSKEPTWADEYRNVFDGGSRVARAASETLEGGKQGEEGVSVVTEAILHALTGAAARGVTCAA